MDEMCAKLVNRPHDSALEEKDAEIARLRKQIGSLLDMSETKTQQISALEAEVKDTRRGGRIPVEHIKFLSTDEITIRCRVCTEEVPAEGHTQLDCMEIRLRRAQAATAAAQRNAEELIVAKTEENASLSKLLDAERTETAHQNERMAELNATITRLVKQRDDWMKAAESQNKQWSKKCEELTEVRYALEQSQAATLAAQEKAAELDAKHAKLKCHLRTVSKALDIEREDSAKLAVQRRELTAKVDELEAKFAHMKDRLKERVRDGIKLVESQREKAQKLVTQEDIISELQQQVKALQTALGSEGTAAQFNRLVDLQVADELAHKTSELQEVLGRSYEELQKELEAANAQCTQLQTALDEQVLFAQKNIQALSNALKDLEVANARVAELEARLQFDPGGSDKIDELEQAIEFIRFELEETKKKLTSKEEELQNLSKNYDYSRREYIGMCENNQTCQRENKLLEAQMDVYRDEVEELQQQLSCYRLQYDKENVSKAAALQTHIDELTAALEKEKEGGWVAQKSLLAQVEKFAKERGKVFRWTTDRMPKNGLYLTRLAAYGGYSYLILPGEDTTAYDEYYTMNLREQP